MEKKKSKKQFQTSTNGEMENRNLAQIDLHIQKKNKKKEKENYEEINLSNSQQSTLEVEESLAKKKKKKGEQETVEESPHKKKKSNKKDENIVLQTTAHKVDELEGTPRTKKRKEKSLMEENWWPPEERTAMLEAMKTQVPVTGRYSRVGYRNQLRKTNWEDVLSAIKSKTKGNSRTINQCQEQFQTILKQVGTVKSLNQILDEALSLAADPGALRREVTQARHRFIKDYMSKHKGEKDCHIMVASKEWTNLPEEEKNKWEEEYQNELRHKGLLDAKSKSKKVEGPENCKFPFELYQEARAAEGEELSFADSKSEYASLSIKKIPFIVESLKQKKIYETEAAKYLEKNPTWKKTKAHGPTNKEIKYYLELLGLPIAPPNTVVGMYYMEEKERFTKENQNDSVSVKSVAESLKPFQRAREALSNLPKEQSNKYKSEWRKSWIEYLSKVEKWTPMVEEKYPEMLEEALAALAEVKAPKSFTESSGKKEPVHKNPIDPLSHIERHASSGEKVKFEDEPPLPARTPYELFLQKFKRDAGTNYNLDKTKEYWGKMSEEKKAVYIERVSELKQRSKNKFLNFVRDLESQQRKLYVGLNRSKLLKYFQEDIFAKDYPEEDYPNLLATLKKASTVQAVKDKETVKEESNKEESDDDEEDEDVDEDEESKGEKEESSSDNDIGSVSDSDSDSDSDSEVEASQPRPVPPFSLAKSGKNSSRLSNTAISSSLSGKLPSNGESYDAGADSDEESDSEDNTENDETHVASKVQSKTNQRIGAGTSTPTIKEEITSDSDSEEYVTPAWDNTNSAATINPKCAGSIKQEEIADESSEEESEESD